MSQLDPDNLEQRSKFGSLLDITDESIIKLAGKIRLSVFNHATPEHAPCKVESPHLGSKNIVFVVQLEDFKMVIRIPAKGRAGAWTEEGVERLKCHVNVLNFLRDHVPLPAPIVYHFDENFENEIGAPYLCTSFMSGETSEQLVPHWYRFYPWHADPSLECLDKTALTPRQEETLRSLASYMIKLSEYSFHSLVPSEPEYMFWSTTHKGQLENPEAVESGPIAVNLPDEKDADHTNRLFVRRVNLNCRAEMILRKPVDFNDILINETGTVIGILDWENVVATPPVGERFVRLPIKAQVKDS